MEYSWEGFPAIVAFFFTFPVWFSHPDCVCDCDRPGRVAAGAVRGALVYQVSQGHRGQHGDHRNGAHAGRVAVVPGAGAHLGVVLLQHRGVALPFPLVRDPATAPDHTLVSTDVLVDFPAEVLLVGRVGLTLRLEAHLRLDCAVFMEERIGAERLLVAVADIALEAGAWLEEAGEE